MQSGDSLATVATADDEPFPAAVCWVVNGVLAAGLWALVLLPFLR